LGLRTADEYRASLRDGRTLWYRGKRVDDICTEPDLRVAVDNAVVDFEMTHDPAHRELAVAIDPVTGAEYHALYALPTTPDDLMRRSQLIEIGSLERVGLQREVHVRPQIVHPERLRPRLLLGGLGIE